MLLTSEACKALNLAHPNGNTLAIIASHDCDLTQPPQTEPKIELIIGRKVDRLDGNYTHSKNYRKLHIEFGGTTPMMAEFDATLKISVCKKLLKGFDPNQENRLTSSDHNTYQHWLSSRYRRSAFPDEFEARLKDTKLSAKITKIVSPYGEKISGIFFDVDSGEEVIRNGSDDVYTLDIYILYPNSNNTDEVNNAATSIKSAFEGKLYLPSNNWQWIELRFCEALSEASLTYEEFKQLKRWRLDHISLTNEQSLIVE